MRKLALAVLLLLGLAPMGTAQDAPLPLDDGWAVAPPSAAGLDPVALTDLVALIEDASTVPNIHAVLIEHEGRLVFESYWPGDDWTLSGEFLGSVQHGPKTLHDVRSVSKSVTSLLLGVALGAAAEEALDRPIDSFLPDRADLPEELRKVSLHHVLSMTAGFEWNEMLVPYGDRNDFNELASSTDPVGYVLNKPLLHSPGQRWTYNSGLTDITAAVIEALTGKPFLSFAEDVLFEPLGISDYEWVQPTAWSAEGFPMASAGLRLSARDLAKIGSVILHRGVWQGHRIVSAEWIDISTTRYAKTPWGRYGYGYFWFTLRLLSGHESVVASGWGGQRVFVLPEAGVSVTILAGDYDDCCRGSGKRIMERIARALP